MKALSEMREIKAAREANLFRLPGVTAVDLGPKVVGGRATEEIAIRVYVERSGMCRRRRRSRRRSRG